MCEEANTEEKFKSEFTCIPRILTTEQILESAKNAVKTNPLNSVSTTMMVRAFGHEIENGELSEKQVQALAMATHKRWPKNPILTVGFLGSTPVDLIHRIMNHLNAWGERGSGIRFVYTQNTSDALVRINREAPTDPQWGGYWSFLGTDLEIYQGEYGQTMNLQGFTMGHPESEFKRVVRHEAGHALGFEHEHKRTELIQRIDRDKAIQYFKYHSGWSPEQTIAQVLTPLNPHNTISTPFADPTSIMAYSLPSSILKAGAAPIPGGLDINDYDYDFAGLIY